jgi:hypothetical protein
LKKGPVLSVLKAMIVNVRRWSPGVLCRYGNAAIILLLAVHFFLIPGAIAVRFLRDPHLRGDGIPRCAFRWHRSLSPRYERWARSRLASDRAVERGTSGIHGTEWPLFGSAFYLWATESLQEAWEEDRSVSPVAPKECARGAIDAAAALVADPKQAAWVREQWGEDYLHRENLFYRELLIAALGSHEKLVGSGQYLPLLRDQVESLSKEIDKSPHGLLDDYPGECYLMDIVGAIASIRRADAVLGTDHSAFVERSIRGFTGDLADSTGLPVYSAVSRSGHGVDRSRGCGDSFILTFAPELWDETSRQWYANYDEHFWQRSWLLAGFREFPKDVTGRNWYMDVDSGPVIAGYGVAASAFGVGAARANGRFDHAYPLSAEMLVACWPLADGTLLFPRILSGATRGAPYLGEACVLFALTRRPVADVAINKGGYLPGCVYLGLLGYLASGLLLLIIEIRTFRRWRRTASAMCIPAAPVQLTVWILLVAAGMTTAIACNLFVGLLLVLCAQFLPRGERVDTTIP